MTHVTGKTLAKAGVFLCSGGRGPGYMRVCRTGNRWGLLGWSVAELGGKCRQRDPKKGVGKLDPKKGGILRFLTVAGEKTLRMGGLNDLEKSDRCPKFPKFTIFPTVGWSCFRFLFGFLVVFRYSGRFLKGLTYQEIGRAHV